MFTQTIHAKHGCWILCKNINRKFNEMRSIGGKSWELQFDNDPKHKSKLAQKYLKKYKIVAFESPPYTPDLNLIENIWGIMVGKLRKKNISTQSELIELVNQ